MRLVLISDTHGKHNEVAVPEGDLLIHAGDISGRGRPHEIQAFMDWFGARPHPHKIFIAGNHDFLAEDKPDQFLAMVPTNVTYLNDSGTEVEGIKIWGSPIQPWFHNWAFNRQRGPEIAKYWDLIPPDTDILITHGPPFGILDRIVHGDRVGCEDLLAKLQSQKPKLHVFGHIHEAYGHIERDGVQYVNASVLDIRYMHTQIPICLDWPLTPLTSF